MTPEGWRVLTEGEWQKAAQPHTNSVTVALDIFMKEWLGLLALVKTADQAVDVCTEHVRNVEAENAKLEARVKALEAENAKLYEDLRSPPEKGDALHGFYGGPSEPEGDARKEGES